MVSVAKYGTWKSPITADLVAGKVDILQEIQLDRDSVFWLELRFNENGRSVVVEYDEDGTIKDLIPKQFDARTRVHEYGGGSYIISDGAVYFSNFGDQRLYARDEGKTPRPLSPPKELRFADGIVDKQRGRLICVREDHRKKGRQAVNTLVSMPLDKEVEGRAVASGHDFFSSPRLSPDNSRLAWLAWDHPNMPWDGTELWVGRLDSRGAVRDAQRVAGGKSESIFQPEWSPDGELYFVSDRSGWWNHWRLRDGKPEQVLKIKAEFGEPQWVFRESMYGFESEDEIICTFIEKGFRKLGSLDLSRGKLRRINTDFTYLDSVRVREGSAFFIGASPSLPRSIVRLNLRTGKAKTLRSPARIKVEPGYVSRPKVVVFPTTQNRHAYAIFYLPKNKDYRPPKGELPPLIVLSHGGPTSASEAIFYFSVQYWTSRGFAVLDVNYGGSTGFGKEYRERLRGNWGVVDLDDCTNGPLYLAKTGKVDPKRLIIRGGSAGGYTTLCALTFRNAFAAGASYFGVSDLEALAKETHKFESRYLDALVGPYPKEKETYYERSPIHFVDRIRRPVILFQGLDDKVVPPN